MRIKVVYHKKSDMAAIPHSMLMAKSRKKRSKKATQSQAQDYNFYTPETMQPAKYSNKMMNSIWGMYNKYSVHNLKAVQGDANQTVGMQQSDVLNNQNNYHVSMPAEYQQIFHSEIKGNILQLKGLGASVSSLFPEGLNH